MTKRLCRCQIWKSGFVLSEFSRKIGGEGCEPSIISLSPLTITIFSIWVHNRRSFEWSSLMMNAWFRDDIIGVVFGLELVLFWWERATVEEEKSSPWSCYHFYLGGTFRYWNSAIEAIQRWSSASLFCFSVSFVFLSGRNPW